MAGLHFNRGAKRAREAREALGLDPVQPVPCLLTLVEERAGLPVAIARLPDDVAGACWRGDKGTLLWVNGIQGVPRKRFTLAHEVGHVRCEHDGGMKFDSTETLNDRTSNPHEVQANAFAAEFLLPKRAAFELFDGRPEPGLDELVVLAGSYGVSAIAALIRLQTAKLVSDGRSRRLRDEIDAGHHHVLAEQLEIEWLEDRLAAMEELPYVSPRLRGTTLDAVLKGEVTVVAAARAAGVSATALAPALAAIS